MGRDVCLSGSYCFYIVGWAAHHFYFCEGKTCKDVLVKLHFRAIRIIKKIHKKNGSIYFPPYPKEPVGRVISRRDDNWWFGLDSKGTPLPEIDRLVVVYWTIMSFIDIVSGNPDLTITGLDQH